MSYTEKYIQRKYKDERKAMIKFFLLSILTIVEFIAGILLFNDYQFVSGVLFTLCIVQIYIGSEYYEEV